MAEFIYTMKKVRKAHGDKVVLDDVTMSFYPGAKIGVVGPNGAGKSSILKIMAGLDQPGNGEAFLAAGASVGILMQEPQLDETKTVRQNVEDGLGETMVALHRYNEIAELMATDYSDALMEEMGDLQERLDHADAWEVDSQLEQAMDALRCPPADEAVTHLSGGEKRRVALCKLLLSKPDLLLLDEPTNHLDAESVLWLEQHLAAYAGAVLAVTHDRYFLDHVAQWIAEVDRGHLYPYEGNYSTYLEKKAERLEVSGKKDQKLQKRLREELAWVRSGAKARQAKSRSRLARYEEMAIEAEKTASWTSTRSRSPRRRAWATWSSRSATWTRVSRTGCSSRICPSPCPATASSVSSAPTASARPPCSRPSSAWSSPTPARSRSARPSS